MTRLSIALQRVYTKTKEAGRGAAAIAAIAVVLVAGCSPPQQPESMVVSAKQYLANNDVDGAIIQLRNALQENPNLDEARFLLGSALFDKGEFLAAEKELRKARELGYSDDAIVPLLVRLLTARGDYRQAIDEFAKVELRGPKTKAELQSALGQAYLETNNIEEARNRFADALSDEPDHPQALLGQARATAIQGDLPKALTLVGIAIEKAPTLPEGWQLKGDILSAQGQTELATGAYRKALEVRPDYVPAHSVLIASFVQQGKFDDGREQLEAMQKAAPKTPQTLYWQALLEFHQKDFVAARDAIQKYLVRVPGNVSGLVLAARIHNELDSYAEAESELKAVLRTFPKDISARMTLIDTYLRMGRVTNALDVLKPLLEDSAPGSDVLALAGELYARNGESVKAARYFEEAAALDPGNAAKRTAVAIAHLARGESDRELGEVGAAAAADTGIRADLAVIATLARQHKFDAALKAIDALEKKQPNSAFTHTLRGEILINKGDIPGARASFERALSIDATNFAATAHLAQLDFSEDKPDAAKRHFDALLAKDPKNAKALLAIAGLRAQTGGTTAEVASLIGEAITAAPTDPEPRLALIAHYLTNGEPDNAVAAGQEAVASMPDRTDILDALGRAQKAAGDTKTAIATYQRLAQLVPESPMPFLRIADLQVLAKDNQGARGSLRKALAVAPDLLEARRNLVILELADGSEQAAVALAREAQKQQPGESAGYVLEGDIYAEKKAWNDAIAAYRNGLKLVGTSDLAIKLIVTLRRAGNNAEADQLTASWRKQHPDDRTFSGYLAESAIAHKDYPNAARQYKAILEKQPNDAVALNNLAWISNRLKDPKALEYAERASALAPNNAAILDTLGGLLLDKGEIKRAVALEQKAVALAHDNPAIRLNYARALIKDDQKELARKELFILQQLGDTYPDQATVTELMRGL